MSGIGHLAAGFAAKSVSQNVSLGVLLVASEAYEILYFAFSSLGIEQPVSFSMDFSQGVRYSILGSNPWSHGLLMSIIWSLLAAAVALVFYRNHRTAGVVGGVVFSHWILDFLMHSNLPLALDGSPLVGLGLENSAAGFIFMTVLDLVLLAGGIILYLQSRKRQPAKK